MGRAGFFTSSPSLLSSPSASFFSLWFTRRRHVLSKHRCCSSRCSLNAMPRGTKTGERFRPHFPFSTRLPGQIGRGSLPITHCPLQLKLPDRECRLAADRYHVSSAVNANLFVATAICSRRSVAEEISDAYRESSNFKDIFLFLFWNCFRLFTYSPFSHYYYPYRNLLM